MLFVSTPQRGSYVAGNWFAHQLARFIRLPGALGHDADDLLAANPHLAVAMGRHVGSVRSMTPGSPLVVAFAPAFLASGVTGHSIIVVKGDGPLQQDTDGVVVYSSAHLEGKASELIVTSGHSVQQTAEAIEEVRRILWEHAEAP